MLPKMNQLAILKKEIKDIDAFNHLISLYNLTVISEEPRYYILDGSREDLEDFQTWWSS